MNGANDNMAPLVSPNRSLISVILSLQSVAVRVVQSRLHTFLIVLALLGLVAAPAAAQERGPRSAWGEVLPGSELERYLRVLQLTGDAELFPWGIRGFSPSRVSAIAGNASHPWEERYNFEQAGQGVRYDIIGPRLQTIVNTSIPHGANDGAVWAGRGVTAVATGGISAVYGPLSATLAPVFFWSQNSDVALVAHALSGTHPYADPKRPEQIDLPQRFGDGAYSRFDLGQSTIRLDWRGLAAGFSKANQIWGPGSEYPLILGPNASGFAHGFLGVDRPLDIWIGKVNGRLLWGRLEQSEFSPVPADSASRFGTGIVAEFSPRGIDGLELGGMRFFHMPWPDAGFGRTQLLAPIETLLKDDLLDRDQNELAASVLANQLAGVFFRWAFPRSGVEIFGEFATDDHRHNLRDLALEPEQNSGYALGFRKAWAGEAERTWVVRGELVNTSASHLQRARRQEPFYVHASTRQGHTNLGQLLGSPAAYGGGGATVGVDAYHRGGRVTIEWQRTVRRELDDYLETGIEDRPDVLNSIGADGVLFMGRWDLTGGVAVVHNSNRNFESSLFNLSARLGASAAL